VTTTGETVWVCKELGDKAGYASPILVERGGLRHIVTMTAQATVGVEARTGRLLWRFPHGNPPRHERPHADPPRRPRTHQPRRGHGRWAAEAEREAREGVGLAGLAHGRLG